jgi:flotillin
VRVADDQERMQRAAERFLGRAPAEMVEVAREVLVGHLRSVLAALEVDELETDRIRFERAMVDEAASDLARLGLTLEHLALDSIERRS